MPNLQVEQPKPSQSRITGTIEINGKGYRTRDAGDYIACTRDVPPGTRRPEEVEVETPCPGKPGWRRWWIFLFTLLLAFACAASTGMIPGL